MKWKEWLIDGMMVMVCVAVEVGVGWRWMGGLVRELIFIFESRMTNAVGKAVGCFEERRRDLRRGLRMVLRSIVWMMSLVDYS